MSTESSLPQTFWIVDREVAPRNALARATGLPAERLVIGAPGDAVFATASAPLALLIAPRGDFEAELDFVHRHRVALATARRLFLASDEDASEIQRLFSADEDETCAERPDPRTLRALVRSAAAHRNAAPLTARHERERIAERFSGWFGSVDVPGLLRALDPALAGLPLLVCGRAGSGRSLVARYAELFRSRAASTGAVRLDGREIHGAERLAERIATTGSLRIEDVDALPAEAQRALAEWMRLGIGPGGDRLHVVATAAPGAGRETLEPVLAGAFAALVVEVPSLADDPAAVRPFAEHVLSSWTAQVGGPRRSLDDEALAVLESEAWAGDRSAVESLLWTALASTARDPLSAADLGESGAALALATRSVEDDGFATVQTDEPDDLRAQFAGAPVIPPSVPATSPPASASDAPTGPSEATADLERAFAEGLPEATPPAIDAPEPRIAGEADGDVSTELGAETFAHAATEPPTPATPPAAPAAPLAAPAQAHDQWRRLARSLSHEIRNPLVSIRTFTELLDDNFEDAEFRDRFRELVGRDVAHIDEVIGRLSSASAHEKIEASPIDVSALLERLLDDRRDSIGERRLLVLRELERDAPIAWADPTGLEVALAGLLDRALASLPERGDLFVATRRIDRAADGNPRLRILLRHHDPERRGAAPLGAGDTSGLSDVTAAANVLEYVLAETIVEAGGGQLTVDATDSAETLVLVDLPTPS
ncbi:MAG: hypothetical protein NXI30_10160 [bacterium]|nr:hypothetical protein [bacterium]